MVLAFMFNLYLCHILASYVMLLVSYNFILYTLPYIKDSLNLNYNLK